MKKTSALPAGVRIAGAAALGVLAATAAWAQTATESRNSAIQTVDQQVTAPVDPVIAEVRRKLTEPARGSNLDRSDRAALTAFYAARSSDPLWVTPSGFTARGRDALAEIGRAEDWGLSLAEFDLPKSTGDGSPAALADAEIKLGLAVLEYARHARGGRLDPPSLSANFDTKPTLRDPKVVLETVAATDAPGAYLVGLHPKHEQFEKLRQALLKVRAGVSKPEPVAEAQVRLPDGPVLKPGMEHAHVALLRQRLKVPAEAGREAVYDPALQEAVAAFQRANKMNADGIIGARTRSVLNGGSETPKPALTGSETQRLIANMERWRWLPEDMGAFHVWDNVPEFTARVMKAGRTVHSAKIVVGKVETQTPIFSANMRYVVFQPEWGVPDSIKVKEIAPYLRSGSGGFFGFFGADTSVLQRHNLKVSMNGKPVDASQVNWDQVDIRKFQFIQPAGPSNVLGVVKFRFPNRHDVYMHDTSQRELFKHSVRAFSHGCMRVDQPGRLAELLLEEDKGWPAAQVQRMLAGGYNNEVELTRQIPVHVTYFTAVADDDGKVSYFGDLYGHDKRVLAALGGKPMPMEVGNGATAEVGGNSKEPRAKGKAYKQTSNDVFEGLFGN